MILHYGNIVNIQGNSFRLKNKMKAGNMVNFANNINSQIVNDLDNNFKEDKYEK